MAKASASAGSTNILNSDDVVLFDASVDGGNCAAIDVICQTGSATNLAVNVCPLHLDGEYASLGAGTSMRFEMNSNGISKVVAHGTSGATKASWAVTKRNIGR